MYGNSYGSNDVFVACYNLDGTEAWGKQFGTSSDDQGHGIAVSGDGVFVTGYTRGNMYDGGRHGSFDVFVARYTLDGTEAWGVQFGSSVYDYGYDIVIGGGSFFVTGVTAGSLYGSSAGLEDVFVARYTLDGTKAWGRQFGTSSQDGGRGIAVSSDGVFVAGDTLAELGTQHFGDSDILISFLTGNT